MEIASGEPFTGEGEEEPSAGFPILPPPSQYFGILDSDSVIMIQHNKSSQIDVLTSSYQVECRSQELAQTF